MELLDRYLRDVRDYLPTSQKEDILRELRDDLCSRIEDREAELGRPINDAEQLVILQQYGHPLLVADRYREERRSFTFGQELIGPALFPLYAKVLWINVGVTLVAAPVVTLALGKPILAAIPAILTHLLVQFAIVTGIYVLAQRHTRRLSTRWDPQNPLAVHSTEEDSRRVPRLESFAQLVVLSVILLPLLAIGGATGAAVDASETTLRLAPVWHQLYLPFVALIVVSMVQAAINLVRPNWTWLPSAVQVGGSLVWLGMLGFLLLAGDWVVLRSVPPEAAAADLEALRKLNLWIFGNIVVTALVTVAIMGYQFVRWLRRAGGSPTVSAQGAAAAAVACVLLLTSGARAEDDGKDWPSYNRDVLGSRYNRGEKALDASNVGRLEEKWRFPAKGAGLEIGVIHATPIVVDGCVYFGTASDPAFYKLGPDGKLLWSYRNPTRPRVEVKPDDEKARTARFQTSGEGILGSALVAGESVYFGDIGGWFYALDRATGKERWKLNARGKEFPDAHPLGCFFASPILVDGKLIVAGGTLEQIVAAFPGYRAGTGRGFVLALDPATGKILWKYDVGPKPEPLDPPIVIKDAWGSHTFYFGPATSSVWSTPSFDAESGSIFFGTDVNTAPRRPTKDDPSLSTRESCGVIAVNVRDGKERWVTQINPGDVWTNAMRSYDPKEGRYKDLSVGDTPKLYTIPVAGTPTKVVGVGCKNGGFYVFKASDGKLVDHTPLYSGPPTYPLSPAPDRRMLALPSCIGGLQTGCATDGTTIYTNGIDALRLMSQERQIDSGAPPTGGRVVALSLDTKTERWRHERPKIASIGGPKPKPIYTDVGDPVASGVAVANGVVYFTTAASGKLVAVDAAKGALLKEIDVGPVWSGPSVSRGRVYVGTGNTLFTPSDHESFFPKKSTGTLYSFGLPGEDEVSRLK